MTTPPSDEMISDAHIISQIHDYIALLTLGLESCPDNEIMLSQHKYWSKLLATLSKKFQRKYKLFPISVSGVK